MLHSQLEVLRRALKKTERRTKEIENKGDGIQGQDVVDVVDDVGKLFLPSEEDDVYEGACASIE